MEIDLYHVSYTGLDGRSKQSHGQVKDGIMGIVDVAEASVRTTWLDDIMAGIYNHGDSATKLLRIVIAPREVVIVQIGEADARKFCNRIGAWHP